MNDLWTVAWTASIPGVGPKRFRSLQDRFPNLRELLTLPMEQLLRVGVPEKLTQSIISHREKHRPEEIRLFCQKNAVTVIPYSQVNEENMTSMGSSQKSGRFMEKIPASAGMTREEYPPLLAEIPDPPVVLYIQGNFPDSDRPTIAVVGTRNITSYGKKVTQDLTTALVHAGCVIVSGFMYGVDAVAHEACVEASGQTIAVLGYGLGVPYFPKTHDVLAKKIQSHRGCLVTEFPPWQHAVPGNFPSRNRIVSGLSLGVLVTEAAQKSGSRITAGLAVDQGREVFAVPGPMNSPYSEGTKDLVNLGAKLVTSAQDIVEELEIQATGHRAHATVNNFNRVHFANELEEKIHHYIEENTQASLEDLIIHTQASARDLAQALSSLELSGVIEQDNSGSFSLST